MAESSAATEQRSMVQFGGDVTDDDLRRLQHTDDVVEARPGAEGMIDEDHVHT